MSASGSFDTILAEERRSALRGAGLLAAIIAVCVIALGVTGFFDLQRFIESGPAISQLADEMIPPDFGRWQSWLPGQRLQQTFYGCTVYHEQH